MKELNCTINIDGILYDVGMLNDGKKLYYRVVDIYKLLLLKKHGSIDNELYRKHYYMHKFSTKGGKQNTKFVDEHGLKILISKSRSVNANEVAKQFGIDLIGTRVSIAEGETLRYIVDAFKNERCVCQYKVDAYRIDLYFVEHALAIECDEPHHKYSKRNDVKRQQYIENKLKCKFVRYNPYEAYFDIFSVINEIFKCIQKSQNNVEMRKTQEKTIQKRHKIQKYSSDGKALLTTYNSFSEMCRLSGYHYARSSVQRAIDKNCIYKDFRWARLDQKMPNDTIQVLPPSKDEDLKMRVKGKENRTIALLNKEMDQIMHAFPDQVSSLKFFNLNHSSNAIKNALSCNRKVNEYWVRHWDDCNEKLKDKFLENNTLPQSRNQYNSKTILQIDSQGNVINRIHSLERFCNDLAIGRLKAIKILSHPDEKYMDFYWRMEKLDEIPSDSSAVEIKEIEEIEEQEETQIVSHKPAHVPKKRHASVIGNKCQRYSQDGKLLKTYDTFTDIFTDESAGDPSVTALKKAFKERKPYRDFIWLKLPREYPDDTIQDINDPIIKIDSQVSHVQKPQKIIEWRDGKKVCEWNSNNSLCKHLKIGRVRLLDILDNRAEYKGSVWTREEAKE